MKNIMKELYAYIVTIYGCFASGLLIYGFIMDELYLTTRLEVTIAVTAIPVMVHGLKTLRSVWIAKTISKKDKEIEEIKKDYQLTIVDAA